MCAPWDAPGDGPGRSEKVECPLLIMTRPFSGAWGIGDRLTILYPKDRTNEERTPSLFLNPTAIRPISSRAGVLRHIAALQ